MDVFFKKKQNKTKHNFSVLENTYLEVELNANSKLHNNDAFLRTTIIIIVIIIIIIIINLL